MPNPGLVALRVVCAQFPDTTCHFEQLEHSGPSRGAGEPAVGTTGAAAEPSCLGARYPEAIHVKKPGGIRLGTLRANQSHQALRHDAEDDAGGNAALDTQFGQARHGGYRVVGVQRGEHQVACHGRVYRCFCRLGVANLTNKDDVRILAENCAKHARERQPGTLVGLDLRDAVDFVFDGILNRYDIQRFVTELVNQSIERGCLAAARRTDHKKDSLRPSNPRSQLVFERFWKSDIGERHRGLRTLEEANNDLLAPPRWQRRHACVVGAGSFRVDVSVLRNTALRHIEVRDHFHSNHNIVVEPARELGRLTQRAMDSAAYTRGPAARFNVNVAGAKHRSLLKDRFLNTNNWGELCGWSVPMRNRPLDQSR